MSDRPALQELKLLRRNAALPQPPANAYPAEIIDKVEDTIREAIQTEGINRGNSANMSHIEEIVKNAITQAHGDTCWALDRIVEEATAPCSIAFANAWTRTNRSSRTKDRRSLRSWRRRCRSLPQQWNG
jgi:hypothetical protein